MKDDEKRPCRFCGEPKNKHDQRLDWKCPWSMVYEPRRGFGAAIGAVADSLPSEDADAIAAIAFPEPKTIVIPMVKQETHDALKMKVAELTKEIDATNDALDRQRERAKTAERALGQTVADVGALMLLLGEVKRWEYAQLSILNQSDEKEAERKYTASMRLISKLMAVPVTLRHEAEVRNAADP